MPELPEVFKASEEQTIDSSFEVIPNGWYPAEIIKSELKQTKAKTGKYLKLTFRINDGDYEGRMIWANLNIINPNETAQQIAKRELASICKAIDLDSILDTEEMHNTPLQIRLVEKPAVDNYPPRNEIKNYRHIDESDYEEESLNSDEDIF